jgi:hypothetical protein
MAMSVTREWWVAEEWDYQLTPSVTSLDLSLFHFGFVCLFACLLALIAL